MAITLDVTVLDNLPPTPDTGFIDHAPTLALRNTMVAAHQLVADPDYIGFTGIDDTTGFTTYTANNADELRTHLAASATTATTKKLITCNWNGVSSWTGSSVINGPGTANLGAYVNGAADMGYNMPPHYTKIVAGSGYSPVLGGSSSVPAESMNLRGFGYVEIDGLGFTKDAVITRTDLRPILPIVAVRNCTFGDLLFVQECRVAHVVGNLFNTLGAGVRFGAQYTRFWDNESKGKDKDTNGDFAVFDTGVESYKSTWTQHLWVAGNILHSMAEFVNGNNHYDWLQYGDGDQASPETNMLIEFNIVNNNAPYTQCFFGDNSGSAYRVNMCVHNNLMTVNAYHTILGKDPSGTGEIRIYRNHALRAGAKTVAEQTAAKIMVFSVGLQTGPTTGVYDIRENYTNSITIEAAMAPYTTAIDNLIVTNTPGPNYVADLFTGNGTWSTSVNAPYLTYDDPGAGLSRAAAFDAIRDFFEPIGGYRVEGYGCTDPATWPATPATLT
jgi:hypothetical protein